MQVSSIFKWYREDFEDCWRGATTLSQFLALYKDSLGLSDMETNELMESLPAMSKFMWRRTRIGSLGQPSSAVMQAT